MRAEDEKISKLFKDSLPSAEREEAAGKRVFYRLLLARSENPATSLQDDDGERPVRKWRTFSLAVAAAAMLASFLFALSYTKSPAPAGESVPGGESVPSKLPETKMVVPPPAPPATGVPASAVPARPAPGQAPAAAQNPPEPDSLFFPGTSNRGARQVPSTPEAEQAMEQALTSRETTTGLSLVAEAGYFQLNRAEYSVPITLKIPGTELTGSVNARHLSLDIVGFVKDDYGTTVQNLRDSVDAPLSDEMAKELPTREIVYEARFTFLPGHYSMKFLVHDRTTGRIGTYPMELVVQNLAKAANVAISSVVLSDEFISLDSSKPAPPEPALVIDGKQLIPNLTRTFSKGRELIVVFEAYELNAAAIEPLTAFVTLFRGGTKVFETAPITVKDDVGTRLKTLPVRLRVPLSSLPLGAYDCQVTVQNPATQKSTVWRAPINVVN